MGLYQTLETDMKRALKEGDAVRLSCLRMLIAAIKTAEIDRKVKNLEDPEILQLTQRQIKQHIESIAQFEKGKRQDLVDKETQELKILESYMPKQLEESEVLAIIKEAISETGAATKSDVGKVMKVVMEKVQGRADGKLINQLVQGLLKPRIK